jgi:hypothetical protein
VQPEHFYFGGGSGDTVMHPLVAVILLVSIALTLVLQRRRLIVPFFICAFLIPVGQMVVLGGVHLFALRILLMFGCARMLVAKASGRAIFSVGLNWVDRMFTVWAVFRVSAFLILFSFRSAAVVNQVATLLDVFGSYFFLRFLIQDEEDVQKAVKTLAAIVAFVGLCMLNEKFHNQNLFGYLGGFPITPQVRDGAIRAQGPFAHPILAGSFGATLLPLFFWLWQSKKSKTLAVTGIAGSSAMVLACASSTPLMAYLAGVVAVFFWPIRRHMRAFRWALVIVLVGVHFVMKAPIWFLIARVDLTGASSGYHRAMLVDTFVRHFSDWWLIGTNTNASWGYDMWDLSNQFVAEGVTGGLAAFISFIAMISICFGRIGRARKAAKGDREREWFVWFLGAALVSHIAAFFGISYFDHTQVAWFALLIMVAVATVVQPKPAREPQFAALDSEFSSSPALARDIVQIEREARFS